MRFLLSYQKNVDFPPRSFRCGGIFSVQLSTRLAEDRTERFSLLNLGRYCCPSLLSASVYNVCFLEEFVGNLNFSHLNFEF